MDDIGKFLESEGLIGKRIKVTDLSFYPVKGTVYGVGLRPDPSNPLYGRTMQELRYEGRGDGHFSAVPVEAHLTVMQPQKEVITGILSVGSFFPGNMGTPEEYESYESAISRFNQLIFHRLDKKEVTRANIDDFSVPITSMGYYFPGQRIQINSDGEKFARWTIHCDLSVNQISAQ